MSFCEAFVKKELMRSDYMIIISLTVMFIAMIVYSIVIAFTSDNLHLLGITLSVTFIVLFLCFLPIL